MTRALLMFMFLFPSMAMADGFGFQTPSGNIYCNGQVGGGGGISCVIVERTGKLAQSKPGSCSGVWGHEYELEGSGRASLSCSSKPSRVDYTDIAPYGVSADFGDISCTSERTGFTCSNKSGHGFFLSRRKQTIF